MRIAVLTESDPAEPRVAAVPETVKKFIALGAEMAVESGAGVTASIADDAYAAMGATIAPRWGGCSRLPIGKSAQVTSSASWGVGGRRS